MEKLLTADDIERVTGVKGVRRIHGQHNDDLEFGLPNGREFIRLDFGPGRLYASTKAQMAPITHEMKGVGDEAFTMPGSIMVRVGNRYLGIGNAALEIDITPEQLKQLASLVLSRLK